MEAIELGTSIDALRALLTEDFDGHKRLLAERDQLGERRGYALLLSAAFIEAVHRRFGEDRTRAEIIRFVGELRSTYEHTGEQINPETAENMILAALGDEDMRDHISGEEMGAVQTAVMFAIIRREQLSADGLDAFLKDAVRRVADWADRQ